MRPTTRLLARRSLALAGIALGLLAPAAWAARPPLGRPGELASTGELRRAGPPVGRPNILVILTDDQRPDGAGYAGNRSLATPNIDRLAAEGARLENFYVATPQCCPSRAALLTGRYGHQTGVTSNLASDADHQADGIVFFGLPVSDLADGTPTIATALNDAGYVTGFVGKAHLGGDPRRWDFREAPVWLRLLGAPHVGATLMVNGEPRVLPGLTNRIFIDAAGDFIERHRSERWFLWLATTAPHDPLRDDPRFPYRLADIDEPPLWPPGRPLGDFPWASYYSTISMLDDDLGALFSRLRNLGLERNTVVFFLSDNGNMAGSHGADDEVGTKAVWFEESARVPAIVRWPERIRPGRRVTSPMVSVDVTATIRRLAGLGIDPGTEGMNMMPALAGRRPLRRTAHAEMYDALHPLWRWQMVREDDWKYVVFDDGSELLYDLGADPNELGDGTPPPGTDPVLARMRLLNMRWLAATPRQY